MFWVIPGLAQMRRLTEFLIFIIHCLLTGLPSFHLFAFSPGKEGWQLGVRWKPCSWISAARFTLKTRLCQARRKLSKGKRLFSVPSDMLCQCRLHKDTCLSRQAQSFCLFMPLWVSKYVAKFCFYLHLCYYQEKSAKIAKSCHVSPAALRSCSLGVF